MQILHVQDRKAKGTPGQSFSGGVFETCHTPVVLQNTIVGASWANHEGELPEGLYIAWGTNCGPAGAKRLAVAQTTSGNPLPDKLLVEGVNSPAGGPGSTYLSNLHGFFELTECQKVKLMLNGPGGCAPATNIAGTGLPEDEVYSDLFIMKVAQV